MTEQWEGYCLARMNHIALMLLCSGGYTSARWVVAPSCNNNKTSYVFFWRWYFFVLFTILLLSIHFACALCEIVWRIHHLWAMHHLCNQIYSAIRTHIHARTSTYSTYATVLVTPVKLQYIHYSTSTDVRTVGENIEVPHTVLVQTYSTYWSAAAFVRTSWLSVWLKLRGTARFFRVRLSRAKQP